MANCPVYNAGDTGNSIFFVLNGKVKVTLSADRTALDSFGMESLPISLHKQVKHAPGAAGLEYGAGCHFGEFCIVSKSGLRAESALVLEQAHLYSLNKDYLWELLLYTMPRVRRRFLHQLMCNLGSRRLVDSDLFEQEEQDSNYMFAPDDVRVRYLFRTAFRIMKDIGQDLATQQREERKQRRQKKHQQQSSAGGFGDGSSGAGKHVMDSQLEDVEEGDERWNECAVVKTQSLRLEQPGHSERSVDFVESDEEEEDDDDEELDPQDVHYDVRVLLRSEARRRRFEGGGGKMLMSLQEQLYHFEDLDNFSTTTRSVGGEVGLRGSMHRFSLRHSPTFRSANHIALQKRLMRHNLSWQLSTASDFGEGESSRAGNGVIGGSARVERARAGRGKAENSALDQLLSTTPTSRMSERGRQVFFDFGTDDNATISMRRANSLENIPRKSGRGSAVGKLQDSDALNQSLARSFEEGIEAREKRSPLRRANSLENFSANNDHR